MNKEEIISEIKRVSVLNGTFTLRSGITSSQYFDKYQFESTPELLSNIAKEMVSLIPQGTEVLAGLEMGGIPIVTMLSYYSGIPATFVRKLPKKYGTEKIVEGASIKDKRVLIIEDVVTSGGQIKLSVEDLRSLGAMVDYTLCVIDREEGGIKNLHSSNIKLISLIKKSELI